MEITIRKAEIEDARRLLEAVKNEARQRGCSRLMLLNNRGRESYRRQFYTKDGWQERPEVANFIYRFLPLPGRIGHP